MEEQTLSVDTPDLVPVRMFLMNALAARLKGDVLQYNIIVKQIRVIEDPDTVWKVMLALNSFVSNFTQRYEFVYHKMNV